MYHIFSKIFINDINPSNAGIVEMRDFIAMFEETVTVLNIRAMIQHLFY